MDYSFSWQPAIRYNPADYVHKWSTPQLIVHGSKDYRLPETEGIGAFHALQQLVHFHSAIAAIWSFFPFIIDWEFQVDWLFSQTRTIGFLIMETGMLLYFYVRNYMI